MKEGHDTVIIYHVNDFFRATNDTLNTPFTWDHSEYSKPRGQNRTGTQPMDSHSTDLRDPVMKIKNSTVLFSKDFFATYDSQYEYAK